MEFKEPESKYSDENDRQEGDMEMQNIVITRPQSKKHSWSEIVVSFAQSEHRSSGAHNLETVDVAQQRKESFHYSLTGLSSAEAEHRLLVYGKNELPEKTVPKWYILVSQFWKPMSIMIWIAVIVEAAIQGYADMGILLAILFINSFIAFFETVKAGNAVAALKCTLRPHAIVQRDGAFGQVDASFLVPGDMLLLAPGCAVPADCVPNEGQIEVDEAALTGESLPITKFRGDSCKMGSNVVRGEVNATVEATGVNTFVGRTANLLAEDTRSNHFQRQLMEIVLILFVMAAVLCVIVFTYLIFHTSVAEALGFTVVLLIASIPLAIEIVTTTTLALGSKKLAKQGAIVTRLSAIQDLAGMSILCVDKTGTLTMNKMAIQDETPIYKAGETQYSLLRYAAMAARWKEPPRDALDTLVLGAVDMPSLDAVEQTAYMPFDPTTKRTEGTVRNRASGVTYKTTKGAPHVILELVSANNGDKRHHIVASNVEKDLHALGERGIRSLAVAKTNDKDIWEFLGMLTFLDPPRPDTKQTIEDANKYGVAVKMITGDHLLIAQEIARQLGLGDYIKDAADLPVLDEKTKQKPENLGRDYGNMCLAADGFAQVFPEHKYLIVECLRELGYKVGMTGDGVNDAPALKRADVGVAVQGATDAARAAADIVLTEPGLSTIVNGILIARRIFVRIANFLRYRFSSAIQLLLFFFIAVFALKPIEFMPGDWETDPEFPDDKEWPSFFSIPVLMLILITLLNDATIIANGYDNVEPSAQPQKWNLPVLCTVSFMLALPIVASSVLLLYLSLTSWQDGGVFQVFGLGGLAYGQITTSIYLQLSVSQFLTLFSARTGAHWMWYSMPSWVLLCAAVVALATSTVLAIVWPPSNADGVPTLGLYHRPPYALPLYIWLYCLVWLLAQDVVKVGTFWVLERYNVFGYNDTGKLVLPESALQYIRDHKESDLQKG